MTGLQFAVLRAYAATLPKGSPEREKLARVLWADLPGEALRKTGRAAAQGFGLLTEGGQLTEEGRRAARAFLSKTAGGQA